MAVCRKVDGCSIGMPAGNADISCSCHEPRIRTRFDFMSIGKTKPLLRQLSPEPLSQRKISEREIAHCKLRNVNFEFAIHGELRVLYVTDDTLRGHSGGISTRFAGPHDHTLLGPRR